ncbi:HD domain-containing protein [bacterium]|nr:HD domain-containing protein [bacterium]
MRYTLEEFVRAFAMQVADEPLRGEQLPRAFFVGGTVRDMVRGEDGVRDIDIEVYGVESVRVQEILEALAGRPVDVFGAAFGVYKISFDEGVIDVALPRRESKKGKGHKGFSITGDPHLSFLDALRRRDFTMNAMLRDVLTDELIDPYHGQDDLVQGLLRVVDARTFPEDPLRVYRGMQFVARFGLQVEENSKKLFARMVRSGELETLSSERITEEWRKFLVGAHPVFGLRFLEDTGLITHYPELDALREIPQDPQWHPEGSVWEHTVRAVEAVSQEALSAHGGVLRLALLLHDVGKAVETRKMNGKIFDEGHGQAGMSLARSFFRRLHFSERDERDVLACVAHHERLPELYKKAKYEDWTEQRAANELRILWRDVGVERVPFFLAVCEANARGRDLPLDYREYPVRVWAEDLSSRHHLFQAASAPLLSGQDVQHIAMRLRAPLPLGKAFGMLLERIEAARDRGEIATRNEAILYTEGLLERQDDCS